MNAIEDGKFRILFLSDGKKVTVDVGSYKVEEGILWIVSPKSDYKAKRIGIPMEKVIKIIEY